MNSEGLARIQQLMGFLEAGKDHHVIDAGTHIADLTKVTGWVQERCKATHNYYHGRPIAAEHLLAEMEMAGVQMALVWQNHATISFNADPQENFRAALAANKYVLEFWRQHPDKVIPGGWVDPKACGLDGALKMVEMLVQDFGFLFVKLKPSHSQFAIDSKPMQEVVNCIVGLGAIPVFHFGADTPFTPAAGLESIASLHPHHPVYALHMGDGGASYAQADDLCQQARELGLWRSNIRYALSAKRDTHIESDLITYQLAGEPYCRNLFCASDAPYGRMAWKFGGFRAMLQSLQHPKHPDPRVRSNQEFFNHDAAQNFLGRNFADFVITGYRTLLEHQHVI